MAVAKKVPNTAPTMLPDAKQSAALSCARTKVKQVASSANLFILISISLKVDYHLFDQCFGTPLIVSLHHAVRKKL